MLDVNLSKLLILPILTFLLISPNLSFASECEWKTIKKVSDGYLYNKFCHNRVGILVKNEKDYEVEVDELRKVVKLKDLSIDALTHNSQIWEQESTNQFQRFERYRKAESTRTFLYIGGGAATAFLLMFLVNSVSK